MTLTHESIGQLKEEIEQGFWPGLDLDLVSLILWFCGFGKIT